MLYILSIYIGMCLKDKSICIFVDINECDFSLCIFLFDCENCINGY